MEDRNILNSMLDNFDIDNGDDLLDILSLYKCKSNPTANNLKALIIELSHFVLVQQPKYVSAAFDEIFSHLKKPLFKDVDAMGLF